MRVFLVTCLAIGWLSAAQSSPLTRALTRVKQVLPQALGVITCTALTCAMTLFADAKGFLDSGYGFKIKELSRTTEFLQKSLLESRVILGDNLIHDDRPSFGYLHTINADYTGFSNRRGYPLQEFAGYLFYDYSLPDGTTYPNSHDWLTAVSLLGVEHHDLRDKFEDGTEGFLTQHLHLIGVEFPLSPGRLSARLGSPYSRSRRGGVVQLAVSLASKVSVGDLGFIKTGTFQQADLDAWAGRGADFS